MNALLYWRRGWTELTMAVYVPIHVTPIPPFDPHQGHGELSSVAHRWQKWLKSFNLFADAASCKNDKQKRQLLLHTAGSDVQDIFYTLTETGTDYKTAAEKLSQYFAPPTHSLYNPHKFRQDGRRRKVRLLHNSSHAYAT